MLQDFDASKIQPIQPSGMGGHPPGIFDFQISNTYLKPSKDNQHLLFFVEFTTQAGAISENFIVDGPSVQAIEIAQKQISALCHAINIYRITYPKNPDGTPIFDQAGRELRGARGRIEVAPQKQKDKSTGNFVETGYMEVKKFFDMQGNEPGKSGAAPQTQPQQTAPLQQAPGGQGGWSTPQQPAQPAPNNSGGSGWGGNTPANPAPANNAGGGWQQGNNNAPGGAAPAANATPPWSR